MLEKHDRLTAFVQAFNLKATVLRESTDEVQANLFVTVRSLDEGATQIVFYVLGGPPPEGTFALVVAAKVDFGGPGNPLVGTLPEKLVYSLHETPALQGIADLFVAEVQNSRCGGYTVQNRLCEVIVVLSIRRAIDAGTINVGLLAGLAHPTLHRSLVAMHDEPARSWRTEELSHIAEMSRSNFIAQFHAVVGQTPGAYLTSWRLALGRSELLAGKSVKSVAGRVGFGSAAAFSRAYSRKYGHAPVMAGKVASSTPIS